VDRVRPRRSLFSPGGLLSHVGTLEPSLMSEIRTVTCAKCHRPLMLIDFYGQQLVPSDLRLGQDVLFPPAERAALFCLRAAQYWGLVNPDCTERDCLCLPITLECGFMCKAGEYAASHGEVLVAVKTAFEMAGI
jgi:hypothetical protein